MTLLEVEELCRYWAKNPPTHLLVAAIAHWAGAWKRQPAAAPSADPRDELIAAGFGQARDVADGLGAVILDFAELKRAAQRTTAGLM